VYTPRFGIVKTKLYIPRFGGDLVHRARLVEKIDQGIENKLLLINAPAGYGKSTMLAEWATRSKMPVCWLSLDNSENDPLVFFANFISSIQTQHPGFGNSIQTALNSPGAPHLYSLINAMINEISDINQEFAVILDDFHHIESHTSIEAVEYLADHQPPNLYLIIAGRRETTISRVRRRMRGELIQLGVEDLRFDSVETLKFLRSRLGKRISSEVVTILENRTEGWIAGLQMAAISMRSVDDLKAFVSKFDGTNRMVTDYLVDEVLFHQEIEIQDFLLKTSILSALSAPLCDHLIGKNYSQSILKTLEDRSLFLIPLDDNRTWYRFHHLFANLLHNRLEATYPDQVPNLHEKASDWYLVHDMPEDAVEHRFVNQDYQLIIQRIEQVSGSMLASGKFKIFVGWLERIPKWNLERRPYLMLVQAIMLFELSDIQGCQRNLETIGNRFEGVESPDGETDKSETILYGVFTVIRSAYYYGGEGDVEKAYWSAKTALEYLPEEMSYWRALAWEVMGLYHQWQGDYDSSIAYFNQAMELTLEEHNLFLSVIAISILAKLYLKTGRITKAIEVCQRAINMDSDRGFRVTYSGLIYITLAELYYLGGQFDAAERYSLHGIDLVEKHHDIHSIIHGYFTLARINLSMNRWEKAQELMGDLISRLREYSPSTNATTQAFACQAFIWIFTNNIKLANRWMERPDHNSFNQDYPFDVSSNYAYRGVYLAPQDLVSEGVEFVQWLEARLCLLNGNLEIAHNIVDGVLMGTRNQTRIYSRLQFLIAKALILKKLNRLDDAANSLYEAIGYAAPENLFQLFVLEGEALYPILDHIVNSLLDNELLTAEVIFILQFIDNLHLRIADIKGAKNRRYPFGLTKREIQIIQWLSKGLSYSETAEKLSISENTFRTHIKSVYNKLGVNNRLQAVNKAEKIGIITKA
jgi:LuxR family maltose regulon positive regulatory protein